MGTTVPSKTTKTTTATSLVSKRLKRRVILSGDSGTQKTSVAVQFPDPIVLQDAISEGAAHLDVPKVSINAPAQFVDEVHKICQAQAYDTVVLDDFDMMVERWAAAAEASCKSYDKRQAYRPLYAQIVPALQELMVSGRNVVITCHVRKDQELGTGKDAPLRVLVHPNLPQALETYLTGVFEVVAYCYNNGVCSALCEESANDKRRIVAKRRIGMKVGAIVPMAQLAQVVMQ